MPLLSYGLGYLLLQSNYERLGLLLLGCCPGGVGSNFWTAMLGGDINLSVTMTFFSSVADCHVFPPQETTTKGSHGSPSCVDRDLPSNILKPTT